MNIANKNPFGSGHFFLLLGKPHTKNPILFLRMGFRSVPKHALASEGFKRQFM